MCLFRKLKKKIDGIANSQLELTQIIKSNELTKLRDKEKKLSDILSDLSHIQLKVNTCTSYVDQNTNEVCVRVTYTMPEVILKFNDKKEIKKNDFFISLNKLDLTSLEDQKRVIEEIEKAKEL